MGSVLPTSANGSQQWTFDPSDTIMQTSEYTPQPSLDSLSAPSEPSVAKPQEKVERRIDIIPADSRKASTGACDVNPFRVAHKSVEDGFTRVVDDRDATENLADVGPQSGHYSQIITHSTSVRNVNTIR
jgi:hypothetical protein